MLKAINNIGGDLLSHSRRIGETEDRVLQMEVDVTALQQKYNLGLVGLPEQTESSDLRSFLEKWLPRVLSDTSTSVIERAHRVGPALNAQANYYDIFELKGP